MVTHSIVYCTVQCTTETVFKIKPSLFLSIRTIYFDVYKYNQDRTIYSAVKGTKTRYLTIYRNLLAS